MDRREVEAFADLYVAGGIAIEAIECWLLVLLGVRGEDVVARPRFDNLPDGFLRSWFESTRAGFAQSASSALE